MGRSTENVRLDAEAFLGRLNMVCIERFLAVHYIQNNGNNMTQATEYVALSSLKSQN